MSLPQNMLAARCLNYGSSPPLELVKTPIPSPGPREVLIKVTAASLCHTDIAMCMGDKINEGNKIPQTAGHEPCGVIVQLGAQVNGFQLGDRVGFVNHAGSCGECDECKAGQNTYCLAPWTRLRGVNSDGCFSEYALGDAIYTFRIPEKLSDVEAAPLMCAGVTAYAAVSAMALQEGQWLAISGCGGVGHLAIQFAKAQGLRTVALDVRDSSLSLAKELGADLIVNTGVESSYEELLKITGGGVHGSLVLAEAQSALDFVADITKKHGSVCLVSAPSRAWKISPLWVIHRDLKFIGSLLATPQQCSDMLKLIHKHDIHIETKAYRFDQVNEMIADAKTGRIDGRLVITF